MTKLSSLQDIIELDARVQLSALGANPELVRQIQHCLYHFGLLEENQINSVYDEATQVALQEFCRAKWLDTFTRGELGKTLAEALFKYKVAFEASTDKDRVVFTPGVKAELGTSDYRIAAKQFQIEEAVLRAVIEVESSGRAFLNGLPVILFEAHWFHHYTGGRFDKTHPKLSSRRWNRSLYIGGMGEWKRFREAEALDAKATYLSTSWGLGQVMGFNFNRCGYKSVQEFVGAMGESAFMQLQAMMRFIEAAGLLPALRRRDWHRFARGYNGEGYMQNDYAGKLERAYLRFRG